MGEAASKQRLTVAILLIDPSGGGALTAVKALAPLLETAGVNVRLFRDRNERTADVHATDDSAEIVLRTSRKGTLSKASAAIVGLPRIISSIASIRRAARRKPELVFLPFLTGTALITLAATLGLSNPVIVCERNDPSRQRHGWHVELLKRLLYPRAAAITVNAPRQAARDHLVHVSRGRPVHFVPNPRPKGIPRADVRSSRVILSVGRLVPQKRHTTLIEAFAQVHERIPEWTLRVAGDGPLRETLTELIVRLDLEEKVELLQHIDDIGQLYASAGLFVLPSDYEGTSNALLEAASAGLPCIVSAEIAPPGGREAFLTAPAGSSAELANLVLLACTDADMRAALGNAARNWVSRPTDAEVLSAWANALPLNARHSGESGTCRSD
jgi:GalNAc-alpha-(1->4)-GalNAc-alpha-(1->3)-diNAcBac-PP-undecaprenol alpha-1,4-N-acetyl-D-galactosaminyltransferase